MSDRPELGHCEYCERDLPQNCFCHYCGFCADCCTAHVYEGEMIPEEYDEE